MTIFPMSVRLAMVLGLALPAAPALAQETPAAERPGERTVSDWPRLGDYTLANVTAYAIAHRAILDDPSYRIEDRTLALGGLEALPWEALAVADPELVALRPTVQEIADILFDPRQGQQSLYNGFFFDWGEETARRLFVGFPRSTVTQAETGVALMGRLMAFLRETDGQGRLRGDDLTHGAVVEMAKWLAGRADDGDRAALVDLTLTHIERTPVDLLWFASEMLMDRTMPDDARLLRLAGAMQPGADFDDVIHLFLDRMRPHILDRPALRDGEDVAGVLALVSHAEAHTKGDAAAHDRAMNLLFGDLPGLSTLDADLPGLDALAARARALRPKRPKVKGWEAARWLAR